MSWLRQGIKKQQSGQTIEARTIRETTEAAEWAAKIRVSAPLEMINTGAGPLIRLAQSPGGGQWAVTAGAIPSNLYNSFMTCTNTGTLLKWNPGLGSVYPLFDDGTCWVADTSKPTIDNVLNFSTTSAGIPANTLVWIQKDIYGNWVITAVDCGN